MTRGNFVQWADVPPGSVVWDAAPETGGDHHASVAVRWSEADKDGCDGTWIVVYGGPSYHARGGWQGPLVSAPQHDRPVPRDWPWMPDVVCLARKDRKVEVLATGITAADVETLARLQPAEILAWCERRPTC
ncbi:MAG: hypothetical protein E6Q97_07840 [Desulfurellales bacterium]|nr:MAG: hypothetical protein E6Q97_07840 [Desulfurellales bacterium]